MTARPPPAAAVLLLLLSCLLLHVGVTRAVAPPPRIAVDLDKPPSQRWAGAVATVLASHGWEYGFGLAFASHNASLFNNLTPTHWRLLAISVRAHYPETAEELQSLSAQFSAAGHAVTFEYLCGWLYFHELAHTELQQDAGRGAVRRECTGLVLQDSAGAVWHSGNMDQSPPAVRNVTLQVSFMRGGELLFEGVDWYWFTTGVTRAVRKGVATLQENWRSPAVQASAGVLSDISAGVVPQVLVFRIALSTLDNFAAVLRSMRDVRLAAPYYVITTGPTRGEGFVLARNLTASVHEVSLADSADPWFIAQTNYEHWLPDNPADPRRTVAERELRTFGQPAPHTVQTLTYAVLSSYPVHNPHTAYTALMSARDGTLSAFVRRGMCPAVADGGPVDGRYGCPG